MDGNSNPVNPLSQQAPPIGPSPTSTTTSTPPPAQPVPPMTESAPPSVVSKKSNKKIFLIAAIIILLLVVVMGIALAFTQIQPSLTLATPTSSPAVVASPEAIIEATPTLEAMVNGDLASELKVYAGNGFSFEYPTKTESGNVVIFDLPTSSGVSLSIENRDIFIFSVEKFNNTTLDEKLRELASSSEVFKDAEFTDAKFKEYTSKQANRVENGPIVTKQILVQKGDDVYLLGVSIFSSSKTADQILSTFKFTD